MPPLDATGVNDWITAPAVAGGAPAAAKQADGGADDWISAPAQQVATAAQEGDASNRGAAGAAFARIADAAVQGAREGFGTPQTILSPEAQSWMDAKQREGGVGGFLAGLGSTAADDIGTVGGVIAGAGNAVFRGGQAAVAQAGAEAGAPQLGRDIAAIPEAFMGSPSMLGHAPELSNGVLPTDRPYIPRSVAEGNLLLNVPRPAAAIADIGKATDIDGAIAAAGQAAEAPSPTYTPVTATQVQARDGLPIMEAWNRARAENDAGAAGPSGAAGAPATGTPGDLFAQQATSGLDAHDAEAAAAGWRRLAPDEPRTVGMAIATDPRTGREYVQDAPGPQSVGAPVPQSVGAAASRDMTNPAAADISTADMKANRRRAEMDELLAPPEANDTMIHVPGSFPTLAERSADPVVSQYENLLRQRNPGEFVGDGKRLTENNKARVNAYDDITVPDTTLNTMRKDRLARWNAASADILPTARPADLTPALNWVQQELSNPRIQENDAVRGVLENFQDRLIDDGGNLKTDPAAVWGIHDQLQNQLAKAKDPLNMTGAEKFAEGQIVTAKGLIDQAMNVATDNRFQSALDGYAEDSKAINAGVLLNDFRPKLTNMSGDLQAANFHRFVVNLAKERGDPGIDPSMDISDQTMRSLINIDKDLKRAGLIKLGNAAGSPTNLLGALAEKAGLDTAHSILGAVPAIGPILSTAQKLWAQKKLNADTARHLAPPEGGYTYPEPDDPPAGPAGPNRPPGGGGPGGASGPGSLPLFRGAQTEPSPAPPAPQSLGAAATRAQSPELRSGQTSPEGRSVGAAGAGPGESIAFTPSGAAVPVRYTVRDASDLIASQLADGRTNPAFPAALQPRDRTRAASIQQVNSIANRLQPERLGASASTSEGAPIIGPDGVVESGNGRTMAIMQAYADGGPLADAYRQWVSAQGHDTARMQNPVLVRERLGDLDMPARARLAADMGASPIAAMSAPERAAADARAIPADILSMYQGGDVTLAKNAPFARAFAEHVIPPGEQAGFMTADGEMSADGAIRMRNALTQHAYGSNSLVTSLAENADPDIKSFGGALMDAAGHMAKLRGAIDSGTVSAGSDIAPDIVAAAQLIQTARRQRISLADAVSQRDAFSFLPEKTEDILKSAFGENYAGRMSRPRMADLLAAYAQEAQMQSGLFGANLTAGEMLAEARAKYGYGTKAGIKGGPGVPVGDGPSLDLNRP